MFQYLKRQNVSIPPLPTQTLKTPQLIGSISFLSSSDMKKLHHLLACHAIRINSSFNCFLSALRFSNLIRFIKKLFKLEKKSRQYA